MFKLRNILNAERFMAFAVQPEHVGGNNVNINTSNDDTVGSNDLRPAMRVFYDKKLLKNAWPVCVHMQAASRKTRIKNAKKVSFRKVKRLPRVEVPLTEGITPDGQSLDMIELLDEVLQLGGYIRYTDVLNVTSQDDLKNEAAEVLGHQAGESLDFIHRERLHEGTSVVYAPSVSGGTVTPVTDRGSVDETCLITVKLCRKIATYFRRNSIAPMPGGDYLAFVHPDMMFDLKSDPEWKDWNIYSGNMQKALYEGEAGRIEKIRFIESPLAKIYVGENLGGASTRNLAVNKAAGYTGAISSIDFDGATVAVNALKGRMIQINGVTGYVKSNTATTITLEDAVNFGSIADNAVIYPGEGGKNGCGIYGMVVVGMGGYGSTELEGAGLEMIAKQLGRGDDPLNQRATIGWKVMTAGRILDNTAVIKCFAGSSYMDLDDIIAN